MLQTLLMLLQNVLDQRLDGLAQEQVRLLATLPDTAMRQVRLAHWLLSFPDELAVALLEKLLLGIQRDRPLFRETLGTLLDPAALRLALGPQRLAAWSQVAGDGHYPACADLLCTDPPHKRYYAVRQLDVNELMEDSPLGWRKTLARGTRRQVLDRLLYDRHPGVVTILLNNPRILERDVVKMAAMQPTSEHALQAIFSHPRWIRRYAVKKALVFNPYTPPSISLSLLGFLLEQDLKAGAETRRLSPLVRERAKALYDEHQSRRLPVRGLRASPTSPGDPGSAGEPVARRPGWKHGPSGPDLAQAFLESLPGAELTLRQLEQEGIEPLVPTPARLPPPEVPGALEPDAEEALEAFLAQLQSQPLKLVPVEELEED